MKKTINFILNGEPIEHAVDTNKTLLKMLREDFDLTGTKEGCGAGECGACTIIMDDKAVNSCLVLAVEADGRKILTIEGLTVNGELDPIQTSFIENAGVQCGFCTPGMIMTTKAMLNKNPNPSVDEIKEGISGNLCRCTGYKKIVEAIQSVTEKNNA